MNHDSLSWFVCIRYEIFSCLTDNKSTNKPTTTLPNNPQEIIPIFAITAVAAMINTDRYLFQLIMNVVILFEMRHLLFKKDTH